MTEKEIKTYDLTDNCRDVWEIVNPHNDNDPTPKELDEIRAIIKAHYAANGRALARHFRTQYDDCGGYVLKFRDARRGHNFHTGETVDIPPYVEVKHNAHPEIEKIIAVGLMPPVPVVK